MKQLLSPRALSRSLRTALAIVTAGWLICFLMHLSTEPGEPGIIIDFIGNQQKASTLRLIVLDFVVYVLQIVRVLITSSLSSQLLLNGTVVTTLTVPPSLASALGDSVTLMLPPREVGSEHGDSDDLFYYNDLVVDIGLRNSIRNVMYADMEDTSTARDGSEALPV
ncbi:hypothetical protein MFLAVUS_004952 [Mucor flavus]|uniref:DUF1746 domain-containing protein n=1 Tax=Mucor flavus TaxID=439312 RepID=A0ABP9YXC0_9FUNG